MMASVRGGRRRRRSGGGRRGGGGRGGGAGKKEEPRRGRCPWRHSLAVARSWAHRGRAACLLAWLFAITCMELVVITWLPHLYVLYSEF